MGSGSAEGKDSGGFAPPGEALLRRLTPIALDFEAGIYEAALARGQRTTEILIELARLYTLLGRITEGLALDRELVARLPENDTVRYNLACSLALAQRLDEACETLEQACALGYEDVEQLLADPDLANLRALPRFAALVAQLQDARIED